jgi:hypothetical protein
MLVKLSVKDRIMLLDLLPKMGSFLFLKMVNQVMEDLSFSEDENKTICFHQDLKGGLHWNEKSASDVIKEINIPETIREKIYSELTKLEEKQNLTVDHINIYEIFVSKK